MPYTNSEYVSFVKLSPNNSGKRKHAIDTITIHCTAGQCTVETLGSIFSNKARQASSNYGIGYDGKIGMYVEEENRSWCTSSAVNDNRAVTIEVASDSKEPYAVKDAAYKSLIKLVADICKRNKIKKLVWSTDKKSRMEHLNGCNMTVHRDYANKSCPGTFLYNSMGKIASEVNAIIGEVTPVKLDKFKIGDIIKFTGSIHYKSANSSTGTPAKPGKAKITAISSNVKHPYHIVHVDSSSNVYGWVDKKFISKLSSSKKTIEEIAKEVIAGKWGNGTKRKSNLEAAGYDYKAVQKRVNELL